MQTILVTCEHYQMARNICYCRSVRWRVMVVQFPVTAICDGCRRYLALSCTVSTLLTRIVEWQAKVLCILLLLLCHWQWACVEIYRGSTLLIPALKKSTQHATSSYHLWSRKWPTAIRAGNIQLDLAWTLVPLMYGLASHHHGKLFGWQYGVTVAEHGAVSKICRLFWLAKVKQDWLRNHVCSLLQQLDCSVCTHSWSDNTSVEKKRSASPIRQHGSRPSTGSGDAYDEITVRKTGIVCFYYWAAKCFPLIDYYWIATLHFSLFSSTLGIAQFGDYPDSVEARRIDFGRFGSVANEVAISNELSHKLFCVECI